MAAANDTAGLAIDLEQAIRQQSLAVDWAYGRAAMHEVQGHTEIDEAAIAAAELLAGVLATLRRMKAHLNAGTGIA
ncbi:MAG: hypothetical protein MUC71_03275 [Steroidobacteraceae bacterium]|jgi:hypothetical protein|nr:hypothetical protein [Steroidobacteraceae bacterium]